MPSGKLKSRKIGTPSAHETAQQKMSGYRDALNLIHSGFETLQFNESTVLSLHRTMLSATDHSYGGNIM